MDLFKISPLLFDSSRIHALSGTSSTSLGKRPAGIGVGHSIITLSRLHVE